ncbi:hypothetical protein AAMO2058_000710700 [Amorphochlora amoebiformis]|mmetsp:Transcript_10747/g.16993  ORF Transcript_10747/g.16993 Transcript_10747/m.16993 type:complete len:924 (-) Transcript_10747:321-3092(-)
MQTARGEAEKALKEVMELLKASKEANTSVQQKVFQKFEEFRTHSEFNQCLAYIFSNFQAVDTETRAQAGVILRRNLADSAVYSKMSNTVKAQVKDTILRSIGDENQRIRVTVGSILATIAKLEQCEGWQMWISMLGRNLDNPNILVQDGAMIVVQTLLEDCVVNLIELYPREMEGLMVKLLAKMKSSSERIRQSAVTSIGFLIHPKMTPGLKHQMEVFVENLIKLGRDECDKVLAVLCCAFTALLEAGVKALKVRFKDALEVLVGLSGHKNELVSYNACEFWATLLKPANQPRSDWFASEQGMMRQGALAKALAPHLKNLVPQLLKAMAYMEGELASMGDEKDAHVPDNAKDIAPRHARQSEIKFGFKASLKYSISTSDTCEWSLRKSSANSLDELSVLVGSELLPVLLPLINALLNHKEWIRRESAVLALGAVASGCKVGIQKHLGEIFHFLINLAKDDRALIRRITCWTLSRYSVFFLTDQTDKKFLRPLMTTLLERMVDSNKKVQKAACSSMAKLHDLASRPPNSSQKLSAFLDPIATQLAVCLAKYQQANLHTLYDCIAAVAKAQGARFCQAKYLEILVPKLLRNWSNMEAGNYGLFPLLECLSAISLAAGKLFLPYAKVIFPQCIRLIQQNLKSLNHQRRQSEHKFKRGDAHAASDFQKFEGAESIVCCVELAGCICRACGHLSTQLADPKAILETLFECMVDEDPTVRQSAMAWLGDITCVAPQFIAAYFPTIVRAVLKNLDPRFPSVCSNAAWAVGEAAVRLGPRSFGPFAEGIMGKLIPVVVNPKLDANLLHNTAITISRMGLVCPDDVCLHLEHFGKNWCQNLVGIDQQREAEMAYRGLCNVVSKRPHAMLASEVFMALCDTIASFSSPSPELHRIMKNLLHSFRAMLHNRWSELFGHCNPELRYHLACVYDLH